MVMLDLPGGTYWRSWSEFLADEVEPRGLVSPDDRSLFLVTDDVGEATDETARLLPQLPLLSLGR